MGEQEKYQAEVEARLVAFGESLNEIKTKQKLRNEMRPEIEVDTIDRKHQEAQAKAVALRASDPQTWGTAKTELESMMDDIDKELRSALAYYG